MVEALLFDTGRYESASHLAHTNRRDAKVAAIIKVVAIIKVEALAKYFLS